MEPGIYKITNTLNGKLYIGSSGNPEQRVKSHLRDLQKGAHYNRELQEDYRICRPADFVVDIIERCLITELGQKETYWLQYYSANLLYNRMLKAGRDIYGPEYASHTVSQRKQVNRERRAQTNYDRILAREAKKAAKLKLEEEFKKKKQEGRIIQRVVRQMERKILKEAKQANVSQPVALKAVCVVTGKELHFKSYYAAEKEGYRGFKIKGCIEGKRQTHKGMRWYLA